MSRAFTGASNATVLREAEPKGSGGLEGFYVAADVGDNRSGDADDAALSHSPPESA
jgi:hypothetical protein